MRNALPEGIVNRFLALCAISVSIVAGCAADGLSESSDHHDHGDGDGDVALGTTSQALVDGDPVSAAVAGACGTDVVKKLGTQLVEEIQCLRPNTMKRIDNVPGLQLGPAVFPFLQTPAADALIAAQKVRANVAVSMNSGLRTLPQQYLLYRWYQAGRCGITLAASPGTSNHESAVAIDINDSADWRAALQGKNFRWLGANDPVHYDFTGAGAVDLRGLSVKAFQRLWNRNNPNDKIDEDGAYGTETEKRLARSPIGGFKIGAEKNCTPASSTPEPGAPPMAPVPDATEPSSTGTPTSADANNDGDGNGNGNGTVTKKSGDGSPLTRSRGITAESGGCSMSSANRATFEAADVIGLGFGVVAIASLATRRRRQRAPSKLH